MKLVVINNYKEPEKRDKVKNNLEKAAESSVDIVDYDYPDLYDHVVEMNPDLVFLSGSGHLLTRPGTRDRFQAEIDLVKNALFPIIGICYGHQLIGTAFGARMVDLGKMITGYEHVELLDHHPAFDGLPPSIDVAESHRQVLEKVPDDFIRSAGSKTSHVEAMYHKTRLIYSFQFHPERTNDVHPHGGKIIQNLIRLAKR